MNKIRMGAVIFALCLLLIAPVGAQQRHSLVYDLYYQLMLYPEHGNQLILNNIAVFDGEFYNCLSTVRERARQEALRHSAVCNHFADPYQKARCEANNEGAKLFRWTNEIQAVCQGNIMWSNTLTGRAAIVGKQALESVNPGQYEQIVRTQLPALRPFFMCP